MPTFGKGDPPAVPESFGKGLEEESIGNAAGRDHLGQLGAENARALRLVKDALRESAPVWEVNAVPVGQAAIVFLGEATMFPNVPSFRNHGEIRVAFCDPGDVQGVAQLAALGIATVRDLTGSELVAKDRIRCSTKEFPSGWVTKTFTVSDIEVRTDFNAAQLQALKETQRQL